MRIKDFIYSLPEDRIAQEPSPSRDQSRMMVVDRNEESIKNLRFTDFPGFLGPGDVLVVNDSRVIPARLTGRKSTGGRVEILLLERWNETDSWRVMLRPAKRVEAGTRIFFDNGVYGDVARRTTDKTWIIDFNVAGDFNDFLTECGSVPLPPYIKRNPARPGSVNDRERYQTIYASEPGSIAAPTAGLHFSENVLDELRVRGVTIVFVTLHVGFGTFLPLTTAQVEDHVMEAERYSLSEKVARTIHRGRRVIAVGTTSVRTIETAALETGSVTAATGETSLFIYPGFRFRVTGGLLTNFHLPASSLFLLICAFGGTQLMKRAYRKAIDEGYRFYSYGDCMLIL
ncbi:MAG: tRNA preQ1(34) S-adenosylmethionine ribosyltransferase-isomerase QueA [Syntrophales bacterium]|jgi:S-adenosylmethionine:tRNA ribosyltransferase-isomerase|nr:tRNA preQ1(34) S-adenosylmethionine ribosyltransferase-isomerase QueA [Syntrophales bacterium]MCK9527144.1 tRNA preQ1(34) S-adenosylmethionine ribosyltransferase-isomerase QueA [Syntrophales bacterium]MDX9921731.1 tRNA preQ1(34) S-adenosylmethionine ribosyltransferase-isomerase QueA [Syntrophales bacterium]